MAYSSEDDTSPHTKSMCWTSVHGKTTPNPCAGRQYMISFHSQCKTTLAIVLAALNRRVSCLALLVTAWYGNFEVAVPCLPSLPQRSHGLFSSRVSICRLLSTNPAAAQGRPPHFSATPNREQMQVKELRGSNPLLRVYT